MNQQNPTRDFIGGFLLALTLHFVFIAISIFLAGIAPVFLMFFFGIGLSQFLYLAVFIEKYYHLGRLEVVKGILVAAFITILTNGICGTLLRSIDKAWVIVWQIAFTMTCLGAIVFAGTVFYCFKNRSRPK